MLSGFRQAARSGPWRTFALILLAGLVVTALLTRFVAEVYDNVTDQDGAAAADQPVLHWWMIAHRTPFLTTWIARFTDLGAVPLLPILATVAAVAIAVRWRSVTPMALVLVTGVGGVVLTRVGKAAVGRTRPPAAGAVPPLESSYAFPSGHSLNTAAIAAIVAYLVVLRLRRLWARVLVVMAAVGWSAAMGASRLYLGHHWLTDVLCGLALGLAWAVVVITCHRLVVDVRERRLRPSPSPTVSIAP